MASLHNSRCSGVHGTFLSPPITWNRQAFLYRPGAVFPVGAVSIFLAYLTPCSSKKSGLFWYIKFQSQHKAIIRVHLRGNTGWAAPSFLSGYDTHRFYGLNRNIQRTFKHITGWANTSSYWCPESHGHRHYMGLKSQLVRANPQGLLFSPSRALWQRSAIHSFNFYTCLVAVLLPVSREN